MKIVKVTWIDSTASNLSWLLMDDVKNWTDVEPMLIYTYGALIQQDDNYVVIAQNYSKDPEQCCSLMSIPKGCIKELKELEEL